MSEEQTEKKETSEEAKTIIVEKATLEEALKEGMSHFNTKKSQLEYSILQKGNKGFLGIGYLPYKVEIKLKKKKEKVIELSRVQLALDQVSDILMNKDGHFSFECRDGAVFIKVSPPEGEGEKVTLDDIVKEVRRPGVRRLNHNIIKEAIEASDPSKEYKIAEFDKQEEFNKDGIPELIISPDSMNVQLKITPPVGNGKHPTTDMVLELLKKRRIKMEPNIENIKNYIVMKNYKKPVKIVEGMPAGQPENGYIKWLYETKPSSTIDNMEQKDYKKVMHINNVNVDDPVGEIIEPENGMDGLDVFGHKVLGKSGKPVQIKLGKNVELTRDGKKIISTIDGQFVLKSGKFPNVFPIFEVHGNVDLKVGNIDFIGNIIVHGNVNENFELKAEGSITIKGSVEKSRIESGDSVIIGGGIVGKEKGIVVAADSIKCKFAENVNLHAGKEIMCQKGLINCNVTAGNKVICRDSSGGVIIGGQVMAGDEISVDIIGSSMGTKTIVVVGIDLSKQEVLNKILLQISKIEEQKLKLLKMYKMLDSKEKKSSEELKASTDVKNAINQLDIQLEQFYNKKKKMDKEIEVNRRGIIRAYDTIHPDVWVRVRRGLQRIDNTIKASAIGYDGEKMRILPLD